MSSHQSNKDKARASKCHHFCHAFDTHNYCPTCREAGKGDDPCVTFISPCEICTSFMEEQLTKIAHRKRYVKKPDKKADRNDQELGQISSDSVRIQDPSKRPSSGRLHPVSPVKERYRKGVKCKISRILQSPVSCPQASPKVEASNRLKQAQHFSTCRKVQNGNSRVHQNLPGSR